MRATIEQIEALYKTHGPAILGYLRWVIGDAEAAEDLLQDTFAEALRGWERVLEAASPRAWLFGIARNLAMNAIRRRKFSVPLRADLPADGADPDARLEEMREAIERLPFELQEPLALRLREGLSYKEVAAVLEIPVGTVRSRLHRAVGELRRIIKSKSG